MLPDLSGRCEGEPKGLLLLTSVTRGATSATSANPAWGLWKCSERSKPGRPECSWARSRFVCFHCAARPSSFHLPPPEPVRTSRADENRTPTLTGCSPSAYMITRCRPLVAQTESEDTLSPGIVPPRGRKPASFNRDAGAADIGPDSIRRGPH